MEGSNLSTVLLKDLFAIILARNAAMLNAHLLVQ